MNTIFVPDVEAEMIPEISAAGFQLGDSQASVMELIGPVVWYEASAGIHRLLLKNKGWIGVRKKLGSKGGEVTTLTFMNGKVLLVFEQSQMLHQIVVGDGYLGKFRSVKVGDELLLLEREFELVFNDVDDEFLIRKGGEYIRGISFVTNYRASLLHAPDQIIERISVHNWELR